MTRTPEACPWRGQPDGDKVACGLASELCGVPVLSHVDAANPKRDGCSFCCRELADVPTAETPGPNVASLVSKHAREAEDWPLYDRMRPHVLQRAGAVTMAPQAIPGPRGRVAPKGPVRWCVGVRTAPRPSGVDYLPATLASLAAAGWPDVRVFAEPGSPLPEGVNATTRTGLVKAWANWYLSIQEQLYADPDADVYMTCEDDCRFAVGAREYVESAVLWPGKGGMHCLSLYTASHYAADFGGKRGWHLRKGWNHGSLAVVMTPAFARALVADAATAKHRWGRRSPTTNTDGALGRFADRRTGGVWCPVPSLVLHMGDDSAAHPGKRASGGRQAGPVAAAVKAATRKPPAEPDTELARQRLAKCERCPSWNVDECGCNRKPPGVFIDVENIGDPKLACPQGRWPKPAVVAA